jgi:uncharacterized repeat protein (TIGR02543 family)
MNKAKKNTARQALVLLWAGMLLLVGCKDLFHPEGPKPVYYTVTFDANGGNSSTQREVRSGDSVGYNNMPSSPNRSGYTFGGWYSETNGNGSQFTASTTVTADKTVYAWWIMDEYTVTFNADGGSPSTQTLWVNSGSSVGSSNMPKEPTRNGYTFEGWYTETNGNGSQFTASTTVTADKTVYAKWTLAGLPANLSLAESLTWIGNNAKSGEDYTITLNSAEVIAPKTLSYSGKTVSITLTGGTTERTASLSSSGYLFNVESGVTLTLGSNITLQGRSDSAASLVIVGSGGTLVMNSGSRITGKTNSSNGSSHGGVDVYGGGMFTMNGGTISGNSATWGGGVFVGGTFTMNGGTISGNSASNYGGGVYVLGTFTMSGGTISGNSVSGTGGGGVMVDGGAFTMSGGTISGNSSNYGGGVYVHTTGGTFIKQSGGVIYGSDTDSTWRNTATSGSSNGHAVYVSSSPAKKRNTTAGSGVTLNSGTSSNWE